MKSFRVHIRVRLRLQWKCRDCEMVWEGNWSRSASWGVEGTLGWDGNEVSRLLDMGFVRDMVERVYMEESVLDSFKLALASLLPARLLLV